MGATQIMGTQSSENYKDPIEEIDPQKYWLVLKRRWLPATGMLIFCFSAAAFVAFSRGATYEAEGKLLFQRRDLSSELTGVGQKISELDTQGGGTTPLEGYLQTQAIVLTSHPLLNETIKALNLIDETGNLIDPDALALQLKIAPVTGTDILQVSYLGPDPTLAAAVVNQLMTDYVKGDIQTNRSAASSAKSFLEQQLPQAERALNQAAENLRQFKQRYNVAELTTQRLANVNQMSTIEQQLDAARVQLANAESRSAELRRQLGLNTKQAIDLSTLSQTPGVQQALVDLQKIQTDIATQSQVYTSDSPVMSELKDKEASVRSFLEERVRQVLGSKASISLGEMQIGGLKQTLTQTLATVEADRLSARKQIQVLEQARSIYAKNLSSFPGLEKTQQLLDARFLAAQTNYQTLLSKSKETELVENQRVGNAQILEQAVVPLRPSGSGKLKFLLAGVVVGLLLGVATAFLLDLIDKTIKTVKDAEALLGFTLLGLIPIFKTAEHPKSEPLPSGMEHFSTRVVTLHDPHSFAGSAYQMLQANLRFLNSDKTVRAIVVTSSVPQEGKSEVAANLAALLAQSGRRVLLVDADMRSPSQHHLWHLTNQIGLSHVLVGYGSEAEGLKEVLPNLTVLTAGVIPPNPLDLIDSETMGSLIKSFLQDYDFVIFDTPPLQDADAAVLGKLADGVLMVVRPRLVTSAEANAAKVLLSRSNAVVLGMVANAVDINNEHEELTSFLRQGNYGDSSKSAPDTTPVGSLSPRNIPERQSMHDDAMG